MGGSLEIQKNPRAHKNKIGTPPPPKTQNTPPPPPKKAEFYGHGFFLQKERIFPGVHKIGAPFPAPELQTKHFTDTRIFLRNFQSISLDIFNRVGLFYLRVCVGLVFFTYGSPPPPEIRFGLFCLRFPPSGNWVWSFLLTVPPL